MNKKTKKRYDFVVDNNYTDFKKAIVRMYIFIIILFVIIQIINYRDIAAQICVIFMVHIPCSLIIMYVCLFSVGVKDNKISVTNWRGKKYSFLVSEIEKVTIRNTKTKGLPGEALKIKTGRNAFRVDRYMKNYYRFKDFIEKNVSSEKIKIINKDYS